MIDRKKFEALTQVSGQHCISFFLPTYRAGNEQEDRIRYKNALSNIKNQLVNKGMAPVRIDQLLNEARSRIDSNDFWQHQSDGLAVFIHNGKTSFYRLPVDFTPFEYLGNHLYLKPLLPVLSGNSRFFLLAISQNSTRLFEGDKFSITEIETKKYLPSNIHQVLNYLDEEHQLQFHSTQRATDAAIYHGHGIGKDTDEIRLREYLSLINKGMMELMCDDDTDPLILATVQETAGIYRQLNDYPHLTREFIPGNPENDDPVLLHEKAWEIIQPKVEDDLQNKINAFGNALAKESASFSLHNIVPAAIAGRVDTLFVAKDDEIWGSYDESVHRIEVHQQRKEDSIPLINKTAVQTFLNGGTVYVLPRTKLPRPTGSINAIYRYSTVPA